jgi:hypothetical protein
MRLRLGGGSLVCLLGCPRLDRTGGTPSGEGHKPRPPSRAPSSGCRGVVVPVAHRTRRQEVSLPKPSTLCYRLATDSPGTPANIRVLVRGSSPPPAYDCPAKGPNAPVCAPGGGSGDGGNRTGDLRLGRPMFRRRHTALFAARAEATFDPPGSRSTRQCERRDPATRSGRGKCDPGQTRRAVLCLCCGCAGVAQLARAPLS